MTPTPYSNNKVSMFDFTATPFYDPREKHRHGGLELVVDNTKNITSETPKTAHSAESLEALGIRSVNHTFHYVRERAEYEANGEEITRKGESRFTSNRDVSDLVSQYETTFKKEDDSIEHRAKQFDFAVEYLSKEQIQITQENLYQTALKLVERGQYNTALNVTNKLTTKQQILLGQASLSYMKKEIQKNEEQTKLYQNALTSVRTGNYISALAIKDKIKPEQQKSLGNAVVEHFLKTTQRTYQNDEALRTLEIWNEWKAFESIPDFFHEGNKNVYNIQMSKEHKARSSYLMLNTAQWAARKDLSSIHIAQALAEYVTLERAEDNIYELLEHRTKETAREARTLAQGYNLPLMRERAEEQLVVHAQFDQERAKIGSFQEAARFNMEWLEDGRVAFNPDEIRAPFTFSNALKTGFRKPVFA